MNKKTALVYLILAIIVANAAYYGFTHYEGPSVYGDDPNYLYLASSMLQGTYVMNPGYIFSLRVMQFAPIALFYAIFGVHTYSASAWDIFSYLGAIIVTFMLGRFFYNDKAGLFAAFTLSIFPLLTKFAVTTGEDPPLMFISSLAVLMLLYGTKTHKPKYYTASGILLVAAWLISYEAGVVIAFVLIMALYYTAVRFYKHRKHFSRVISDSFYEFFYDLDKGRYLNIYKKAKHLYDWIGNQGSTFLVIGVIIGLLLTFIFSAYFSNAGPYVTITRNLNFYSAVGSSINGLPTIPTTDVSLMFYPNDMFPYHIINMLTLHMSLGQMLNTIRSNVFGIATLTEFGVSFYVL
ncbi:MAG: glycosyltransferase family 39 protein, partial [Methanothrix sp.]